MTKILEDGEVMTRVDQIKLGDRVDLYEDRHADPDSDPGKGYEFEYCVVCGIDRETPGCIRLDFEHNSSVGFPPEHELKVAGNIAADLDAKIWHTKSIFTPWHVQFPDGHTEKFKTEDEATTRLSNHRSDNNLDAITGEYLGA